MKKIVPDPPHINLINTPYFAINNDIPVTAALAHASELLRCCAESLEVHCHEDAEALEPHLLSNAIHAATSSRILIEHALAILSKTADGDR
ncbi:DUF3077 domain-containing protein [Pseudomonas putida]